MNMSNNHYEEQEFDYQSEPSRRNTDQSRSTPTRQRKVSYARSRAPVSHNGIHRRRNKRFSW